MIRPGAPLTTTASFTAAWCVPPRLHLERGKRDDVVLAGEDAHDALLELVAADCGQEPDPAEVRPDHRDAGAEEPRQRAQHRAVAPETDRKVRVA